MPDYTRKSDHIPAMTVARRFLSRPTCYVTCGHTGTRPSTRTSVTCVITATSKRKVSMPTSLGIMKERNCCRKNVCNRLIKYLQHFCTLYQHSSRDEPVSFLLYSDEKTISCELCDKKFYTKGNYQSEPRIILTLSDLFSCQLLFLLFTFFYFLPPDHMFVHNGLKPHACGVCGKAFSMKSNMLRHEKLHAGLRPFPCPDCDRRFTEKRTMDIHRRVHTGERPYK